MVHLRFPLSSRLGASLLLALALLCSFAPPRTVEAAAGEAEQAQVIGYFGSGAIVVRNDLGEVYGVVYAGMDGSQPAQNAFSGFHDYASQGNAVRVVDSEVSIQPISVMGQTPEGMLVVVGNVFLPGKDVPVAADLIGSGLGWYHPDPANPFDGFYGELQTVAQQQANGVWGWPIAVPYLGATPPPPTPSEFALRPVPTSVGDAWDVLINSSNGAHFSEVVQRSGVRFRMRGLSDTWAQFRTQENLILLDRSLETEDPRAVATVLAHEITHVNQFHGPPITCVQAESEAFIVQTQLWIELTGDDPPDSTALEQQLNLVRKVYEDQGSDGITLLIIRQPGYQRECGLTVSG